MQFKTHQFHIASNIFLMCCQTMARNWSRSSEAQNILIELPSFRYLKWSGWLKLSLVVRIVQISWYERERWWLNNFSLNLTSMMKNFNWKESPRIQMTKNERNDQSIYGYYDQCTIMTSSDEEFEEFRNEKWGKSGREKKKEGNLNLLQKCKSL